MAGENFLLDKISIGGEICDLKSIYTKKHCLISPAKMQGTS